MNRDQLVEKMNETVKSAAWGHSIEAALDVVLAEVLQPLTHERAWPTINELLEYRKAQYSAPREKTLVERVEAILNDRGYTWSRDDARDISKSIVALLEEGGAQ